MTKLHCQILTDRRVPKIVIRMAQNFPGAEALFKYPGTKHETHSINKAFLSS